MRLFNPLRRLLPEDTAAPFRIIAMLLPLAALLELCAGLRLDISSLRILGVSTTAIAFFFPSFHMMDYDSCRYLFLALSISIIVFYWTPDRLKKPLLCVLAFVYCAYFLGLSVALSYFLGLIGLFLCFSYCERFAAKVLAILVFTAVFEAAALSLYGFPRLLLAAFTVMSALKAYSEACDLHSKDERPGFFEHVLALVGGVPCNFVGPRYPYASFNGSFLRRPWPQIAQQGVERIYRGFFKLAVAVAYYLFLRKAGLNPDALQDQAYLSTGQLWSLSFFGLLSFLLRVVGCLQILQGLNRLFGYDVPDQTDQPWLAASPLDFWRRFVSVDREYMMKYVFLPAYRRWENPYAALIIIFHVVAGLEFLMYRLASSWPRPSYLTEGLVQCLIFIWVVSAACCVQSAAAGAGKTSPFGMGALSTLRRRALSVAVIGALLCVFGSLRWVFSTPAPWPNQIPGRTPLQRYGSLYACFLGRCAGKTLP